MHSFNLKPLNLSAANFDYYNQANIHMHSPSSSSSISECHTPTMHRLPSFAEGFLHLAQNSDNSCKDNHCQQLPSVQNLLKLSYPSDAQKAITNPSLFAQQVASSIMKRPRRRSHEIARRYPCIHPGCGKAYGALNHLNAHIVSKGHGPKRTPQEFQALRNALKEQAKYLQAYSHAHQLYRHQPY